MPHLQIAADERAGDVGVFFGIVTADRKLQLQGAVNVGDDDPVFFFCRVVGCYRHLIGREVERCRPGQRPRVEVVVVPLGLDGSIFGVTQAEAVNVVAREPHRLPGGMRAAEVIAEAVADDDHVAAPVDGHTAVGGQAHRVDTDGRGVEWQVGIGDGVVEDGVGIDLCRLPDCAVRTYCVWVVPILALVAGSHYPFAKARPHDASLVVDTALDVAAADFAAVVGAHVDLAAGERGGGDLQRGRADGRGRDAPHRRINRVGRYRASERLQVDRPGGCLLDGGHAGLVVDAADAHRRPGRRLQAVVELAATVKIHLAANRKAHRAGDDALGVAGQEVDAQRAGGRLFRARVLGLLPAKLGGDDKAVVNRRGGERLDVLVTGKHHAVERFDRLRRPLRGDNLLAHRLLAVDGFGDFDDRVRLKFDDAGRVVNRAARGAARVAERARAVVAHGHVGVDLAGVGLARLHFGVVVLDEDVVHQLDRARFDLCLAEGEVDVAAAVA